MPEKSYEWLYSIRILLINWQIVLVIVVGIKISLELKFTTIATRTKMKIDRLNVLF